jgi:hypothetical protein
MVLSNVIYRNKERTHSKGSPPPRCPSRRKSGNLESDGGSNLHRESPLTLGEARKHFDLSFDSSFVKKIQFLPDLVGQPMTDQGLIGYRLDRGQFSNGANLERIHFDGDILKFSFPLLGKDILQKLIV